MTCNVVITLFGTQMRLKVVSVCIVVLTEGEVDGYPTHRRNIEVKSALMMKVKFHETFHFNVIRITIVREVLVTSLNRSNHSSEHFCCSTFE